MRRLWVAALATVALAAVVATRGGDPPPSLGAAAEDVVESGVPAVLVRLRTGDEVHELAKGEASPGDRFRVGSVTSGSAAG